MKKAVVNIVKDLVSELTFNETINSCEVVDSRLELTVANTHGLVVNGKITIGDDTYTALKVEDNTITVSGNSCPSDLYLTILPPTYIHGTVKAASSELTQIKKSYSRFQIVYLYEVIQETRNRNPALSLDRSVEVVMFFLTSAKMKGELTDDKYSEYINQMDSLAEDFISVLESSPLIGSIDEDDYTIIPHSIAGFYDRIGHVKNLFNESYSGVELRVKLPINKSTCDKEDGTFVIPSFVRVYNSDETYDVNVKNGNELGLPDIDFTDSDGTTTSVPSMEDLVCTPALSPSGIAYQRSYNTLQSTSYAIYDDAWQRFVGTNMNYTPPTNPTHMAELDLVADPTGLTLKINNAFGNKFRFTTSAGTFPSPLNGQYVIDHLTGLGWWNFDSGLTDYNVIFGIGGLLELFNTALTGGYNDFFVPNTKILFNILSEEDDGGSFIILPLQLDFPMFSSTNRADSLPALRCDVLEFNRGRMTVANKTSLYRRQYCRVHYK